VGKWLPEGHEAELAKWLPVCEELRKWLGPAKQDATAKPTLPNHLRLTLLKFGMKTQFYQTNNSYHMGLSKHIQNITRSDILGLMVILDGMQKHDGKYKDNEEFVSACHELESWLDEATQ
jgi:hypothetical protein